MLKKIIAASFAAITLMIMPAAAFDITKNSDLLMLVNQENTLPDYYIPPSLETVPYSTSFRLRKKTSDALALMLNDMTASGINGTYLKSGFRSFSVQSYLISSRVAERQNQGLSYEQAYAKVTLTTAPAGASEHQLGLACDLTSNGKLNADFATTPAGVWLSANCWRYGFILRYPAERQGDTRVSFEPWHFRYVGTPHAQIIKEKGWIYEDYIAYLKKFNSIVLNKDEKTQYVIHYTTDTTTEYNGITDISKDNTGGYIVTTLVSRDPFEYVYGNWAEQTILELLKDKEFAFTAPIKPDDVISCEDFSRFCALFGLDIKAEGVSIKRQNAIAQLVAGQPNESIAFIEFSDINEIDQSYFQSVQKAVYCGVLVANDGALRPCDALTWGECATLLSRLAAIEAPKGE